MTNEFDGTLVLLLGVCVLAWLALGLYALLTRLLHDIWSAIVDTTSRILMRGLEQALADADVDLERLLRRLPKRTAERVAADGSTPEHLAFFFATRILEQRGPAIEGRARAAGSVKARWNSVTALRILARARWSIALPLLGQALESDDEEVVAAAVTTLGERADFEACEFLVRALRRDLFGRSRIAAQLDAARAPISDLLTPLLREQEPQLRFWGATLLSRYAAAPSVEQALCTAIHDTEPSVRAAMVESLTAAGAPSARRMALILLEDPVWFVRAHAVQALRTVGGDELVVRVAPLLADESWWVRSAAKEALAARPAAALHVLVGYLDHQDEFARNGAAEVLQNTGALDGLVKRVIEDASEADVRVLRKVLLAGGQRLTSAAAVRNGLDTTSLEALAATAP